MTSTHFHLHSPYTKGGGHLLKFLPWRQVVYVCHLYFNAPSNMYMLGPDPLPPILTDIRQPISSEVSTISARYYRYRIQKTFARYRGFLE
jgi:hypothetical protein